MSKVAEVNIKFVSQQNQQAIDLPAVNSTDVIVLIQVVFISSHHQRL